MSRITVTPLAPALGAEIGGVDLREPIGPDALQEILDAWHKHLVLRFRGQRLGDPELLAFSRLFGELDPPGPNPYGRPFLEKFPEINVISNVKRNGVPIGGLGDGEATWHSDMTYVECPPRAAALHALELPASGGDTYWSNQYMAYDTLPDDLRRAIEGRVAVHDATCNSAGFMRKGYKEVTDPREAPGARHLSPGVAALRPARVGQPLHAASARRIRSGGAPHHAPHADQGARDRRLQRPMTARR